MKRLLFSAVVLLVTHFSATAQLTEQQQIQKLNYVYQQIRNNYVDDVPLEPLVEGAIKATLKELDPHSQYLSQSEMTALKNRISGEFAGLGIHYIVHRDTLVVRTTIANSPARKMGIKPNDRIIAVDGHSIVGISADDIMAHLQGKVGSKVALEIKRRNVDVPVTITLSRESIETTAVDASFCIDKVGYISIKSFSKPTAAEFYDAYLQLGDIKSLIIDLRNNGGGALSSAIDLTSLFLKKDDVIVSTNYRNRCVVHTKRSDGIELTLPIVVLINENSASASEIFAGAIQDHDRGIIVGHTSFGKGLVQRVIDLKDGTGMTLTIAHYKTPSGRTIQRPYKMGNGDEYRNDPMRYMHPDSIPHDDTLLFRTLHQGRKVYGGGGITPDIYIDTDSLELSDSLMSAYLDGQFQHTVIDYWDIASFDEIKKQYPTYIEFADNYTVNIELIDMFHHLTKLCNTSELENRYISTMLKATMAEQLYGNSARQYIYSIDIDQMMQRTLAIAQDMELMRSTLKLHQE